MRVSSALSHREITKERRTRHCSSTAAGRLSAFCSWVSESRVRSPAARSAAPARLPRSAFAALPPSPSRWQSRTKRAGASAPASWRRWLSKVRRRAAGNSRSSSSSPRTRSRRSRRSSWWSMPRTKPERKQDGASATPSRRATSSRATSRCNRGMSAHPATSRSRRGSWVRRTGSASLSSTRPR